MSIRKISDQYVKFLSRIGKNPELLEDPHLSPQFTWADALVKTLNQHVLFESGDQHLKQLKEATGIAAPWAIEHLETLAGEVGDDISPMSMVRYNLVSEKIGTFKVSVHLYFNKKEEIERISEVVELS